MSFLQIPPEILSRPDLLPPPEPWRQFESNSIAQARAFLSWAPEVGYSGRLGSSKTRTCGEGAFWDASFWSMNRVALARKRSTDLFATTFPIFMEEVLPPHLRKHYRPGAAGAPTLFLPNGSVILFIGLDEPMKLKSGQYGSIYVDQAEDLDEEEHATVESRLRHRVRPTQVTEKELRQLAPNADAATAAHLLEHGVPLRRRVLYAFNPAGDLHWGNVMFRFRQMQELPENHPERWRRVYRTTEPTKLLSGLVVKAGQIIREAVIAQPPDNTENMPEGYLIDIAQKNVGPWGDRFVKGLWGTFEGQVFPNFRESVHVIDRPGDWDYWGGYPPPSWSRFRSVDFGYGPGHPFVMSWFARRPASKQGRPAKDYLYQEIYWTGRGVAEHAVIANRWDAEELAALNRGVERWNEEHEEKQLRQKRYLEFAGQWSDPARPGDNRILADAGIVCDMAINDRLPGAQLIAERLEPVSVDRSNPGAPLEPRLVFVRSARREADPVLVAEAGKRPTQTFEELSGIRWLKKGSSDERGQKEDWVKDADDGCDCVRYMIASERERGSMQAIAI